MFASLYRSLFAVLSIIMYFFINPDSLSSS